MHKSVGAIIKNPEGRILMIDRTNPPYGWACPAGHIDESEAPEQALKREITEETNLEVVKYKLLYHEFIKWNKCRIGEKGHDWYLYKVIRWKGDLKIDKKEAKDWGWFSEKEIKKLKKEKVWEYWLDKFYSKQL